MGGIGKGVHAGRVELDAGLQRSKRIEPIGGAGEPRRRRGRDVEQPAEPSGRDVGFDRERRAGEPRHAGSAVRDRRGDRVGPGRNGGFVAHASEQAEPVTKFRVLAREGLRRRRPERRRAHLRVDAATAAARAAGTTIGVFA